MTHATTAANFAAARPDFIHFCPVRGGFVYGSESGVHASNTAADIARSAPIPTPTPMPGPGDFDDGDSTLCADCRQPCDDRCYECRIDLCSVCNERWHRHGQPASPRRNGAAFFTAQRAASQTSARAIDTNLDRARRHAAELHGDIGDAAYSERVQAEADALFN